MANTYTVIGEQRSLDWLFTTGSPTRPTTWYVSLHTAPNGGAGATAELSGNGYARQAVTFTRSAQTVSNNALITFGPNTTTNWGTVTDACVWDSVTAGVCLAQGSLTASVAYAVGDSATIASGQLTIQLT